MINVLYLTHEWDEALGSTLSLANMLHALRDEVRPVVALPREGKACDYLSAAGYACRVVPFLHNIAPRRLACLRAPLRQIHTARVNGRALRALADILAEERIELVHSNTSVLTLGYDLARRVGLKHVWHLREFQDLDFGNRPLGGWAALKRKIHDSDASIAITQAIARHFDVGPGRGGHVIHDAVRRAADTCLRFPKAKYLLFCGHVIPTKGAGLALELFARFARTHPGYRLRYLGNADPRYRQRLEALAARLGVGDSVEFLGYQADVRPYMEQAAALLMCSRNEAQGRVTVEAMFYGCPVLGFRAGGTAEIVEDGRTGYLFSTPDEGAEKLSALADGDARPLVREAQAYAVANFSEEVYREKLLAVYSSLL